MVVGAPHGLQGHRLGLEHGVLAGGGGEGGLLRKSKRPSTFIFQFVVSGRYYLSSVVYNFVYDVNDATVDSLWGQNWRRNNFPLPQTRTRQA